MFFISFYRLSFFSSDKKGSFFFFLVCLSHISVLALMSEFNCRCGVLTTLGGIAGLGWANYWEETMIELFRVGWKILAC